MTDQLGGPHGVLIVDKPTGPTSHDIVAQARRHFRTRRVGHAGTLDPMASGVLVLLLGEATKLSDVATCNDKAYLAEVSFGRGTSSHDAEGTTTEEVVGGREWLDEEALRAALDMERQRRWQQPPAVSAIKVGGRRAYRLSRAGAPPELEPRAVSVRSLRLVACVPGQVSLELHVSKGYYVRALARDIASAVGVPAHLSQLRRLASGRFTLADACPWPPPDGLAPLPLTQVLPLLLPTRRLLPSGIARARCGQLLMSEDFLDEPTASGPVPGEPTGSVYAWTDAAGAPIALGERHAEGFRVRRGFTADLASQSEQIPPIMT